MFTKIVSCHPWPFFVVRYLHTIGAGCDRPILRDHYMGKSWLQPDKGPKEVVRDEEGEPIVEKEDAPAPE